MPEEAKGAGKGKGLVLNMLFESPGARACYLRRMPGADKQGEQKEDTRMLTNDRERAICKRYSARDETGTVHCKECTLRKSKDRYDFQCKANSHYDRHDRQWKYDEEDET